MEWSSSSAAVLQVERWSMCVTVVMRWWGTVGESACAQECGLDLSQYAKVNIATYTLHIVCIHERLWTSTDAKEGKVICFVC